MNFSLGHSRQSGQVQRLLLAALVLGCTCGTATYAAAPDNFDTHVRCRNTGTRKLSS